MIFMVKIPAILTSLRRVSSRTEDTVASKILIFQLPVHKEKLEIGYKLLYSVLAELPQAL